jgi:glycosyltransferase involved in cell wall biosynthesis
VLLLLASSHNLNYIINIVPTNAILLLIPNLGMGGAQRVFHDHSVELAKHYAVTEAVFNLEGGDTYPSGNPVVSLEVSGGGGALEKVQNFWRRVRKLRRLREEKSPAAVISHLEGADYVNLLSGGPGKIILCIHGSKLHDANISGPVGWLRKRVLMPWLYNRADAIVTVSRDIKPELIDFFGVKNEKILTINNFFEVASVETKAQEPLSPAEQAVYASAPILVTSGRLTRQKNQVPLLTIFADLLRQQPTKLVFVGDGELRDDIVSAARQRGLRVYEAWGSTPLSTEYDVYFMGMQTNPFKYIRPATLFVFPSAWEGFPMALGEAMICGVPVVSTDCPTGPREMLAPSTTAPAHALRQAEWAEFGVLMPMLTNETTRSANEAVWTSTLLQLLADVDARQRLGHAARRRMNDFTRERIAGQWVQLLENVIKS